jgi:transposase
MWAISNKDRESIVFHKNNGEKNKDISKWLRISERSVARIWNRYKQIGIYKPNPQNSGRKALVTQEQMDKVVNKIKSCPDITLTNLIDEFFLGISQAALCKRLCRLGFTLKKRRFIHQDKNVAMSKKTVKIGEKTNSQT